MTIASSTDLCNKALSHLGVSQEIASLTDGSKAAQACNRFYAEVIDEVLRAFPWPFATIVQDLALVTTDPTNEWAYSYRYPSDCLMPRRILNGSGNPDTTSTRVVFRVARDAQGRVIWTNQVNAQLEYTQRVTAPEEFDPEFVHAASFLLAAYVGPRVMSGDPSNLAARAANLYRFTIEQAWANAANGEVPAPPVDSDLIASRD